MGQQGITENLTGRSDGHWARPVLGAAVKAAFTSLNSLLNWFEYDTITLADDAEPAQLSADAEPNAFAFIFDTDENEHAIYSLEGGAQTVSEVFDSGTDFAAAAVDTDGQTNITHDGSAYVIDNQEGAERTYEVMLVRVP